jgi:hypothetical protein
MPAAATGTELDLKLPVPSWPAEFSPQHQTAPATIAQVCPSPLATAVTSPRGEPPTVVGTVGIGGGTVATQLPPSGLVHAYPKGQAMTGVQVLQSVQQFV